MAISAAEVAEGRVRPRSLPGATVLQVVDSLRDEPSGRAAIAVAQALIRAGARAIVAAEFGILVNELRSFGGEWLAFSSASVNPMKLRRNAELLDQFVATERIDIVHARNAGAAWSALIATERNSVWLVTDLPDPPRKYGFGLSRGALGRGHNVIARSLYEARPIMARQNIPPENVKVVPRSINTDLFNPATVSAERIAGLRQAWGIPSGVRVILVPGPVAPWCGQIILADTARILTEKGTHGFTIVLAGDDQRHRRTTRALAKRAIQQGVEPLFRLAGPCADMPAAYAAADVVVIPYAKAPIYGRIVAEAQAMARPVITTSVGDLPEHVLAPPRMPDELRTGWVVQPGNPADLAKALAEALSLDPTAYRAFAARAHEFGRFMFAPHRVAAATLEVYTSLLETEA
jgi:glycosyltransferase involved in cell wall biosynthesis